MPRSVKDMVKSAQIAIGSYQTKTKSDDEDVLCDLLADLKHWADSRNYDFEAALVRAEDHHKFEKSDRYKK